MPIEFIKIKEGIPQTPGVYFFKDSAADILYVGKAANLRSRLSSYFLKNTARDAAKRRMLQKAATITWQETSSETEALLVEAALIKKHLPPYNIVMRDDKQYLFVGFTKEKFPRIIYTHQPIGFIKEQKKKEQVEFLGPFTEATTIKKLLRSLRKTFPYCTCKKLHKKQCQQAELDLCFGFCCIQNHTASNEERTKYRKHIRFIKSILTGKQTILLEQLRRTMQHKSKQKYFEEAAELRNKVQTLERIFAHRSFLKNDYATENQKGLHELKLLLGLSAYPKRIEGYDISNIQGTFAVGSMVVFIDGVAEKNKYRKFRIRTVQGANDPAMMQEVLVRRLRHLEWRLPDVILIDGGRTQLNAAKKAARDAGIENLVIVSIAKREEELYLPNKKIPITLKTMPRALLYLLQQIRNEAHRFAISYYRKRHRKAMR